MIVEHDLVYHAPCLIHAIRKVYRPQYGLETVGPHVRFDAVGMPSARAHQPVDPQPICQNPVRQLGVRHLVLLEIRHGTFRQVGVRVHMLAHQELQDGIPEELQPLV